MVRLAEGLPPSAAPDDVMDVVRYRKASMMEARRSDAMTLLGALRLAMEGGSPLKAFGHLFSDEERRAIEERSRGTAELDASVRTAERFRTIMARFKD